MPRIRKDPPPIPPLLLGRGAQNTGNRNQVAVRACEVTSLVVELPDGTASAWHGAEADLATLPSPLPPNHASRFCVTPGVGTMRIKVGITGRQSVTGLALELFPIDSVNPIWTKTFTWAGGACPAIVDTGFDGELNDDPRHHDVVGALTTTIVNTAPVNQYPDGYLTVASPLYLLRARITSVSGGYRARPSRVTLIEVRVASVTLEWAPAGDRDLLPQVRADVTNTFLADTLALEAALVNTLAGTAVNADHEVVLDSNYFTTNLTQEGNTATDILYNIHRDRWGHGPRIPLLAKVRLVDAHGAAVDAPLGLGGARFLWDWDDRHAQAKQDRWLQGTIPPQIKAFVTDALDCMVQAEADAGEAPEGSTNTHRIHGGKRGTGSEPVFPQEAAAAYAPNTAAKIANAFPFVVDPCPDRRWAALSKPRTQGFLAGYTGVIFQPSRMAGDIYKVRVFFVPDDHFPFDTATPGLPTAPNFPTDTSGYFEVWRSLSIKYLVRAPSVIGLTVNAFENTYKDGGMKLLGLAAPVDLSTDVQWGNAMATALVQTKAAPHFQMGNYTLLRNGALDPQTTASDAGIAFDNIALDWTASHVQQNAALFATRFAEAAGREYAQNALAAYRGVALFSFGKKHRFIANEAPTSGSTSSALATRDRANLFLYHDPGAGVPSPTNYFPNGASKGYEAVAAHEIAHTIALVHAPVNTTAAPDQHQVWWGVPTVGPSDANQVCVMNYHSHSEHFCGVCVLRLRGWNAFVPKPDAALVPLATDGNNAKEFRVLSIAADLPATPPRTHRLYKTTRDNATEITRTNRAGAKVTDLTGNAPIVLLHNGWEVGAARGVPVLDALLKPVTLVATVIMPNGARVVWKVERAADDGAMVIAASPNPLPTITPDPMDASRATLSPDAVGTFHVKASVDVAGGTNFDDNAEFGCVNVVLVGVTRVKSNHGIATRKSKVHLEGHDMLMTTRPQGAEAPVVLKTTVQLMGGGPQGQRGLDKVHGGWVNTIKSDVSIAHYADITNNDWRGKTLYITRAGPAAQLLPLVPPESPAAPLRDSTPDKVWLSEADPNPANALGGGTRTRVKNSGGAEVQITAKDAPGTGWDIHPPTQPTYDIKRIEMDIRFCAFLTFWTADAPKLFAVCEEVPWFAQGDYEVNLVKATRKRVAMKVATDGAKVKHVNLTPASAVAGIELARPASGEVLQPRNDDAVPVGSSWK
ncbi:MAG: hypothetical protein U0326_33610 [Polyangiales bacterium]